MYYHFRVWSLLLPSCHVRLNFTIFGNLSDGTEQQAAVGLGRLLKTFETWLMILATKGNLQSSLRLE